MTPLPAFNAPGRFYKGNLHTHSTASDAVRSPADVCATYRDAGYDFLALTDHFQARYNFPITDTRPFRTNSFTTILGAEVHAPKTSLGEIWHILSVGLPPDFAPTPPEETGPQLAARCAAAGAFVAIAHPAWYGLTIEDGEAIAAAHAVETYNRTSAVRTDRGDGWALLDAMLARGHRLNACATDDAHFKCNDFFGGFVMVRAPSLDPDALLTALKAGHYYSSQGPELHSIHQDGDHIAITCSPATTIMMLGRGSGATQIFGDTLTSARLPIEPLRGSPHARIVTIDANGKHAWSNPFWFDALNH